MAIAVSIKAYMIRVGNPSGTQDIYVYEGSGTDINDASIVATASLNPSTVPLTQTLMTITLDSTLELQDGKYYFIAYGEGLVIDGSNLIEIRGGTSSYYWVRHEPLDEWDSNISSSRMASYLVDVSGDYLVGDTTYLGLTTGFAPGNYSFSPIGYLYEEITLPSKPINPTPTNSATEVDFSDFTLSWEDGGGADTYDVYIGPSGSLVKVSSGQAGLSYVTNIDEVPYNQVIYWRVDAVNATGTTTGDTWNFDARPAKAITPYPAHEGSGVTLDDTTSTWESGSDNTTGYDVYFGYLSGFTSLIASDVTDLFYTLSSNFYTYGDVYYWKVKAKNIFGITDGDEWYFTSLLFYPVLPTGVTMVDGSTASGTTGTPTGENNMMTTKRLIAATNDRIWYEEI